MYVEECMKLHGGLPPAPGQGPRDPWDGRGQTPTLHAMTGCCPLPHLPEKANGGCPYSRMRNCSASSSTASEASLLGGLHARWRGRLTRWRSLSWWEAPGVRGRKERGSRVVVYKAEASNVQEGALYPECKSELNYLYVNPNLARSVDTCQLRKGTERQLAPLLPDLERPDTEGRAWQDVFKISFHYIYNRELVVCCQHLSPHQLVASLFLTKKALNKNNI